MARDLKKEMPITAFVKQLSAFGSFNRQPAEDERPRRKPEILIRLLTLQPNTRNNLSSTKQLL